MKAAKECVLRDYEKSKMYLDFRKKKPEGNREPTSRWWHSTIMAVVIVLCYLVGSAFGHELGPHPKGTVVIGGDYAYPPYEFIDESGEPAGFNVELTRAIAEVMEMNVEFYLAPWSEIQAGLRAGQIDAVQRMSYSEERSKLFDFSPPHTVVHQAIFVRKDSPKLKSIEDLEGKEIIIRAGDIMQDFVPENGISDKVIAAETSADAFRLLASGEHDCVLTVKLVGLYWIDKLKLDNIIAGPPIVDNDYCFAVQHGNAKLLADFTEGLSIIEHTGQYKAIYDKWLGVLEPHGVPATKIFKYAALILLPLLALLIGSAIWSTVLKRKVAQRTAELQLEVAERKRAEESVRESEQRMRSILNSFPDHILQLDKNLKILWANKTALEKAPDTVDKLCYELYLGKNEPCEGCPCVRALESGHIETCTMNHQEAVTGFEGDTYWDCVSVPLKDSSGKTTSIIEISRDVTERRLAEKERERLMYQMEERIKELNCIFGVSDLIAKPDISMNEIFEGMAELIRSGWQYPEITCAQITMNGEQYHSENFRPTRWMQSSDILVHGEVTGTIEVCYLEERPKSDEGPFLKEERSLINAIAERLGRFYEQKEAEEGLKQSEERFDLAVKGANDGLWDWSGSDIRKETQWWSPQFYELLGYKHGEIEPSLRTFERLVHPEDKNKTVKTIFGHLEGRMPLNMEYRLKTKSGEYRWFRTRGQALWDQEGNAVRMSGSTQDITERKRAEEEIEMLAKFPSENPDPVLRISKDGILLYTNTASELLLSECGCKLGEIVCEEWLVTALEALSSGTAKKTEREVGSRVFSIIVAPIVKSGYVNVYGRDITERKRAKESVENLRRQNEMILNSAGEGIFGLDCEGRHTFINPAAANMLGYKIDELLGQPSHEIWHSCRPDGEIYPEEQCPIYAAYRDGKIHRGDNEVFWRKDGSWFPVEYVSTPIRENGKLAGAVVIFGDITERKRIENELAESEQKYRDLYDYAPVGYHEIDTTGRIVRINQTEAQLLGYKVSELIGKSKIDLVVPEQRETARSEMTRRFKIHWKWNSFDRKFVRKDGRVIDVHIQERPLLNEASKITGIRSTVQDITERRRSEQGLQQMREELESAERFAAAGQIAMQIAHEIGNPMALISGQIQYMIEKGQSNPEDLRVIIGHIDSISQLIKRFSELKKERPLRWSEEAIEPIIDSTLSLLAYSRRFAKLTIKKEISVGLPKIRVDKSRITQVLLNLLLNASEACGDSGKITVRAEASGEKGRTPEKEEPGYMAISVEDTGSGIKQDDINKIFDPFYSTKPAGEGTGLGLPVSTGIAREHNGRIDVESSPGKGSRFTLWLPIKSSVSNRPEIRIEAFASKSKKTPAKLEHRYK